VGCTESGRAEVGGPNWAESGRAEAARPVPSPPASAQHPPAGPRVRSPPPPPAATPRTRSPRRAAPAPGTSAWPPGRPGPRYRPPARTRSSPGTPAPSTPSPAPTTWQEPPRLRQLLDAHTPSPAFAGNRTLDVLATNDLTRALRSPFARLHTLARMTFLDPVARHVHTLTARSADFACL